AERDVGEALGLAAGQPRRGSRGRLGALGVGVGRARGDERGERGDAPERDTRAHSGAARTPEQTGLCQARVIAALGWVVLLLCRARRGAGGEPVAPGPGSQAGAARLGLGLGGLVVTLADAVGRATVGVVPSFSPDLGHVLAILADGLAAAAPDGGHVLAVLADGLTAAAADHGHVLAILTDRGAATAPDRGHVLAVLADGLAAATGDDA